MTEVSAASMNRVVLVTGAAKGIGSAISHALLKAGHLIAAVDIDDTALETQYRHDIANKHLEPIIADLAEEHGCNEAVIKTISRFGHVDAVINNVGIGVSSIRPDAERRHPAIEEITTEIWDQFFSINVRSAMLVTRAAVPHMKMRNWGRVINNTTSYRTMLRVLPYGATKAALEAMSAVWAVELQQFGITVNVLVPGGPTDTALVADESGWPREKLLRPEIMGTPACWLVSDDSSNFTGRRVTAKNWDERLPPAEAANEASRSIGWPELVTPPASWQTR